jgi:methionine-rich copper-binding protein CopC
MIAASVANFIEAVDAQFATLVNLNKAPPPGLVVDWLEFAFDLIGFMTEDFAPPTGELARLFNKADLARLTSWHNGLGMASKAVSLLDMFFEMSDLVKFAKCVSVTSSAQINFDPLTWLPFFDGLDSASQKMLSAVKSIFGNNLADIFGAASTFASTTTRTSASVSSADIDLLDGILFATDGGRLRAFNSDGSPVPDPRTGKPLDEPIENLIDSRLATDGDFRLAFLRDFKDGVAELAAFFSDSSEPYVTLKREVNQTLNSLNGILSELPSSEPSGSMYVRVTDAMTGQLIYAGKSNDGGNFEFASPPNSIVLVEGFDPSTGSYGRIVSPTGASGQTYGVRSIGAVEVIEPGDTPLSPLYGPQPLIAIPDPGPDSDGDGLGDLSEGVLGTNPNLADTDGDGINDLGEIKASGDPLGGRAFPTGVVASLPLQGEAKAVTLEGSTTSAETQTAYVATGSHGLAIVDASNFQRPLVLSQLDLAGDAVDVAIDARLGIAAVASTTALHLVNVSDPSRPALVRSIPIAATQVEVADGVAYVAIGTAIESYSLLTGERLQLLPVGATNVITALARDGTTLYALDASRALHAIDISGLLMTVLGGIGVPAGTGNVFVGNGIAYIGAVNTRSSGFVTVDVSNPRAMTLLGEVSSTDVAGQAIVANGSGLAVSVGSAFTFVTGPIVNVLDVRDPTNTGSFLTSFSLAADPFDIAIGAGIAFVADGTGGLQVVNYLPFDNQGQAPTITLGAQHADQDPGTAGIQALEGSLIDLKIEVNDDQQVRNLELLVDGQVVSNDVAFPWAATVALPVRTSDKTTAVIQARVTDTGGNTTFSDALVIDLVADTFAPTIEESNVADGSRHGQSFRTVRLRFSEALDPGGISAAHFRLLDASDTAILPIDVALDRIGRIVTLTMPDLAQGAYRLVIDGDQVKDRAGNNFGSPGQVVSSFEISEATIKWTASGGGDWNDPANWDQGRVPDASDDVWLAPETGGTITLTGEVSVGTLAIWGETILSISFGTLHVAERIILAETSSITFGDGGAIAGTTVDNPMTIEGGSIEIFAYASPASLAWVRLYHTDVWLSGDHYYFGSNLLKLNGIVWLDESSITIVRGGSLVVEGQLILNGGGVNLEGIGFTRTRLGLFGSVEGYGSITVGRQRVGDYDDGTPWEEIGGSGSIGPGITTYIEGHVLVGGDFGGPLTNYGFIQVHAHAQCTITASLINEGAIGVVEGSTLDDPLGLISGNEPFYIYLELLVDAQVVTNDVAFPWTATVTLPARTPDKATAVIQARVTDTGGNTTLSDVLVIDLVADTFAPTIEDSNVADSSRHGQSFRTVRLRFSEALDLGGISAAHFRLLDASDTTILPIDVALDSRGQIVTLTMPELAQGAYWLVIDGDHVTDRTGNAFGSADQVISGFEISEATIKWLAPSLNRRHSCIDFGVHLSSTRKTAATKSLSGANLGGTAAAAAIQGASPRLIRS